MSAPKLAGHAVDDQVWVHAFGNWRRGTVVRVGRTRLRVRYVSRRDGTAEREQWFAATAVHDGHLPAATSWHCDTCGYALHGRPGQTAEQIRDDHHADPLPAAHRAAEGRKRREAEDAAGKCPRCVYGEPADHTCDAGQQARHAVEMSSPAAVWGER